MVPKAMCNPNQHQCRDGSDDRHDNEERIRLRCAVLDSQNSNSPRSHLTLSFPTMFHFGDPNQTETRGGVELCKHRDAHTFKRKTKQEIDGDFEIEKQNRKRSDVRCGDGGRAGDVANEPTFCFLFTVCN